MLKSDTDSYNYSTIDESVASTESTLRYCLWKKGTQFTYDIPDGLIEGDCVEVKGRLTGKRVVLELSGAPTRSEIADNSGRNVEEEHRVVPLRLRFNRAGRYKLHSDHLGREADKRGRFRCDFQADSRFTVQIRIQSLCYDIRINDNELTKLEHGQYHSEIQMLSLDGEAEFLAVEFIDIEDLAEEANTGLAINMPIGEPMDDSSPASEPELRVSKMVTQQSASKPSAAFEASDNVDGRMKQQLTKRRTEVEPEKSPDVKVRKTKTSSSAARERDSAVDAVVEAAAAALVATQKAERHRAARDEGDASRRERRLRDRKPRLADIPMTDDKVPKPSDGEPTKSKRSSRRSNAAPADKTATAGTSSRRDRSGMDESDGTAKAASPKRTKTKTSSRTSSRASNSSNSEAASTSKLDSVQPEQQLRQKHRTSQSPSSQKRRQSNESPTIDKQPLQSQTPQQQQQQQQQQQRSESQKAANLEVQRTKTSSGRRTQQHPDDRALDVKVDVDAEEELVRASSVRMTEALPPRQQADSPSSRSDRPDEKNLPQSPPAKKKSESSKTHRTDNSASETVEEAQEFEQRVSGSQRAEAQPQKSTVSSSSKTPRQQRLGSSKPDTDPSQDPGPPSGSYTVDDVKPHKLKLDSAKSSKLTTKSEANQLADSPLTGSYAVKSSSSKVKQQRPNASSSTSEPQQEPDLSGSYGLQQKPSQPKPPKSRLSSSKADQETSGPPDLALSGSYSIAKNPPLKAGEEPTQLFGISSKRRGSAGDKKAATMDGVYRVIPITPVTPAQPVHRKQPKPEPTMADSLWTTQQLDEGNLISLSIAQIDSTHNLDGSEAPDSSENSSNNSNNNNNNGDSRKRNGSSSSSSGLSSVAEANKNLTGKDSGPSDGADLSRQYMYYAAELSPASPKVQPATATAGGESPVELARDASAFLLEPQQQQQQQQLPRSVLADVHSVDSNSSSRRVEQRRKQQPVSDSLESINDTAGSHDANDAFRKSESLSENMYSDSKVYDTINVESEPEPFVAHLPEPLRSGRRIIVAGQLNDVKGQATISLRNRNTANVSSSTRGSGKGKPPQRPVSEEEFRVQLTHRKEDGSTELLCRQFNGREWTSEQRSITRAFNPSHSARFKVEIHTSSVAFNVRFEDSVCVQPHTIPFSNFTHLVLDGYNDYQNIEFPDELELPYSEEFPQSLDLVGHILVKLQLNANVQQTAKSAGQCLPIAFGLDHGAAMLCVLDPAKQSVSVGRTVPETGGFLCDTKVDRVPDLVNLRSIMLRMDTASVLILLDGKPVLSYNLLTQKHYITSFFIDGNFLLKDVSWKEKRASKWTPIPPSFQVGRSIRVAGLLPSDGRSVCSIALTVDTDLDSSTGSRSPAEGDSTAAFCLRCEPGRQPTVASSASSASVTMQRPPLASGQRFEAHILCRLTGFEVTLGDCEAGVCQVPHGVEPRLLRSVRLTGGAVFYEVEFNELLGLPYMNRFPVSLKESRFVTVDVANGLHAPRPNTISFALCTGPGDSCLKPLVCEFNMAQGYASVAWADAAGQLCDEATRKFDPRLAGEIETVALQATDSDYILSVNETALLKYPVRHNLDEIQYVLIDGDICINSVQFEGKAASPSCCIN